MSWNRYSKNNNYSALASYEDGIANGWWLYMGDYKDSFLEWLIYEDGQIIEEDGFGFVSEKISLSLTIPRI